MTGATEHPAFPAHGPGFPPALPATLPTPPVPVPPGLPPLGDPTPPTPRPPARPAHSPNRASFRRRRRRMSRRSQRGKRCSLRVSCCDVKSPSRCYTFLCPPRYRPFQATTWLQTAVAWRTTGHWRFQIKPTRQSRSEWRAIEASTHQVSEEVLRAMQIMSFVSSPGSFSNQITLNVGS
jgi:hypothetical protein